VAGITNPRDLLFLAGRPQVEAGGTIGQRTPENAVKSNGVQWHILNHSGLCALHDAEVYDARHNFM
jgi:hypothetical protein